MTDTAAPDPMGEDPAVVGFALLMAGVESAVAAAAEEIAALGEVVRQGAMGVPTTPPPALPTTSIRPPAPAASPPSEQHRDHARPDDELPAAAPTVDSGRGTALPVSAPPPGQAATAVEPAPAVAPAPARQQESREASSATPPASAAASLAPAAPVVPSPSAPLALHALAAPPVREGAPTSIAPTGRSPRMDVSPIAAPPPTGSSSDLGATPTRVAPMALPAVSAPVAVPAAAAALGQQAPVAPSSVPERSVAPVTRGNAPSPSPSGSGGPTQGDVFLDGVRVGRWMADTLARAAGGPSRGSTGFDPRMGPRWPGALQGR